MGSFQRFSEGFVDSKGPKWVRSKQIFSSTPAFHRPAHKASQVLLAYLPIDTRFRAVCQVQNAVRPSLACARFPSRGQTTNQLSRATRGGRNGFTRRPLARRMQLRGNHECRDRQIRRQVAWIRLDQNGLDVIALEPLRVERDG